ncbi:MAG: glutamine-hydrolyzing GMP synthase, partial [Proteobacteria bacterium]
MVTAESVLQETGGFAVLDFGSQLTQLIARRLRELNVYSELLPFDVDIEKLRAMKPKGIILSGGPSSVHDKDAPLRGIKELQEIAPLLGICYGMQLMASDLGGIVESAQQREYGLNHVTWSQPLSAMVGEKQRVWMSHGDIVKVPPPGFKVVGLSDTNHIAAMAGEKAWGIQFHPEVAHTEDGLEILRSFVFDLCDASASWDAPHIAEHLVQGIRKQVGDTDHVLCGLSGGVDSSVVAALLSKALGPDRVHCVFVNNGLLRKNEYSDVLEQYKKIGLNVTGVNAEDAFLKALAGLEDPEAKRKAIGRVFIEVFQKSAEKMGRNFDWLAQGTLYPDVIESISIRGASVTIKSHHNVGGLPAKMNMKLVEPLRELFKDEVRALGRELDLPKEILGRHPFPGPGLSIRLIGAVNKEDLETLREADHVYINELRAHGLYDKIWQAFCVLLPVRTVGVQGDGRTYEKVLALRAVTSSDGMTADWYPFTFDFLRAVSNRITNEVKGVNRVVYDVTSKP